MTRAKLRALEAHREALLACRRCPDMHPPVVCGPAVVGEIYLVGQAPGPREGGLGRPFAHTAGQRLFAWFGSIGVDEATFRARAFMAAVARCFPGKAPGGGDRVPRPDEIVRCRPWIEAELAIIEPRLVIAVGRLAIEQVLGNKPGRLDEVVGLHPALRFCERTVDVVCLPHPSGVSTWHKTEPGRTLLEAALAELATHPSWRRTFAR